MSTTIGGTPRDASARAALKPFVRTLGELEPDIATALSPWLPRLSLLVGALARAHTPGGDPDGFDGVSQRGRYERLLLSEWAIALELPDEFLRRAVMSEHLFIELKRREPQGALHSLVVVDPGPDQLGAPRLLHLAAAIVGEARARAAKAAFAWGATTEPVRLFPRVDPESARFVLDARRSAPLTSMSLERWHSALARFEAPAPSEAARPLGALAAEPGRRAGTSRAAPGVPTQIDVLFVGGAHLERVVASSPFAGSARVLRVDALSTFLEASLRPAPRPRPLRLPLPDDALAVRALRDPFGVEKKGSPVPVVDVIPSGGLVIPLGGRRIFVRTRDGIAALVEPNSPRALLGAPRRMTLAKGDSVVAAGLVGRRPLVIVRAGDGLLCAAFAGERHRLAGELYPHLEGDPIEGTFVPATDRLRVLQPMAGEVPFDTDATPTPMPDVGVTPRAFLDDGRGYALLPYHRRVTELAGKHLITPLLHKGASLTVRSASDGQVHVTANGATRTLKLGDVDRALLGALHYGSKIPGVLALGLATGVWVIIHSVADDLIVLESPGIEVLAAVQHPVHGACLVGKEDARRLAIVGKDAIERHAFASDIVEVVPNLELPQLAVLTRDGNVTIVFLKTGVRSLVCRGSGA